MAEAVSFSEEGRPGRKLTRVALEVFAGRGWINPPAWAALGEICPIPRAHSYLESLRNRGLLRRKIPRGLLVYRLSDRGEQILRGLRRQLERGD